MGCLTLQIRVFTLEKKSLHSSIRDAFDMDRVGARVGDEGLRSSASSLCVVIFQAAHSAHVGIP